MPGLDVTYSSDKDQFILKRKLEQVKQFRCKYFDILFDDFDSEIQQADKVKFKSFADAQSYLTNFLFEHLGTPDQFYFCPTEYCDVFARPNVDESEYLRTIGEKLLPNIRIMWTGPGIVSEYITIKHIRKISEILKRKPLIWDNFHANDYDLSCIFLGPFTSRSTNLRKYISGMLTNPNCEFECNYVPIYTLSLWSHSTTSATSNDEFNNCQSVIQSPPPPTSELNDIEMILSLKDDYSEENVLKIELIEYIDQLLANRGGNSSGSSIEGDHYECDWVLNRAIKKWLPILNEKQDDEQKIEIFSKQSNIIQFEDESTTSALNSTTKQKAQQVACNSLIIKSSSSSLVSNNNGGRGGGRGGIIVKKLKTSKLKKKLLKKFLFYGGGGRNKRERVDGGEIFKHRFKNNKNLISKFKKRKKKPLITTNDDDDMDSSSCSHSLMDSQLFLSPSTAQTMIIDEMIITPPTYDNQNDIELLSTRASSIASCHSSSSSLLSFKTKNNKRNKRKKYEPFVQLSSSSKTSSFNKALRKKLKKTNICTSPMDLGMLSDHTVATTTIPGDYSLNIAFNESDLKILIDLYYLPFEYGKFSIYLLKEFQWMKINLVRSNENNVNILE